MSETRMAFWTRASIFVIRSWTPRKRRRQSLHGLGTEWDRYDRLGGSYEEFLRGQLVSSRSTSNTFSRARFCRVR